jgi:23S rRNA G2445 N2-methylase RlmL
VLVVLVDREIPGIDLADTYDHARSAGVPEWVSPGQSFGVRPTRHGDHDFESPAVGERVGQAVVDAVRAARGDRPPVDLDAPDVVLRAFVREETFLLAVDATGERSLHRRPYRVSEHDAPVRPTIAWSLLQLAGYTPGDTVLDPTCGSATIPIEAALDALDRSPTPDRSYAAQRLRPFASVPTPPEPTPRETLPDGARIEGVEIDPDRVEQARTNVAAADLTGTVRVRRGDATALSVDADRVVANLPFGHRTDGDLAGLYGALSARLREGRWRSFVALTTRPELLEVPVERELSLRYGRLAATVVVAER